MSNLLVSLELQGYKTFASKTEFKFPAQLTAIVGPNGSGKSNIADAIRWVLGEQAYSLLRGKKTVDMIFSGSEQRPRASMASASITFDNSSGWLPIEFNEVNLTRRAYRNGENEYLINNHKVRLKEINELLANSGLAERNYTIIGQGLVDSALSLKPEDRRSFFEEAAGIGLYRSRRSEANKKLEKTQRNVERINDIVLELKPRLRSLEKQQEKSISFNQINADLQLLLKDWYGYHWHRTQKDLQAAIKVNAEQQIKVNNKRVERKRLEEKLEKSQKILSEKRLKLSELHKTLSSLHDEKEDNARQIAVLEEREQSQKLRLAELQNSFDMNQAQLSALENEIQEQVKHSEKGKQEFGLIEKDLREAQSDLDNRISKRNIIEKDIQDKEKFLSKMSQEILRLQTKIEGLQKQIKVRESNMTDLEGRFKKNKKIFSENKEIIIDRKEKNKQLLSEIHSNENKRDLLIGEISELNLKIEENNSNKSKCENLIRNFEGQFDLIDEAEKALVGFSSGAKSIMDAFREGKLQGDYKLLMDLLEVPEKYEVAIASALGVVVEGIIINSTQGFTSIIDYIERTNTQRTVLIDDREVRKNKSANHKHGKLIKASEISNKKNIEKNQTIIENLLSGVYIAENISIARECIDDLEPGNRIVTLSGEVFNTDGTIMVGKETRAKNFERKREKKVLIEEINKTKFSLSEIEQKLKILANDYQSKKSDLDDLNSKLIEKQKNRNQLDLEIHKLEIEQSQREGQIEVERSRLEKYHSDMKNESLDVENLTNEIARLKEKSSEKKNHIEDLYRKVQELPVEALRSTVMDMHSKLAVAKKIAENEANRIKEKYDLLEKYHADSKNVKQRINETRNVLVNIANNLQELKSRDKKDNQKIGELTQETKPLEREVEQEITNQGNFLEVVDSVRQKYAIAERHKLQAQIKVEKLRERLENYQQKIGEDFGIFTGEEEIVFGPKPLPIEGVVSQLPKLESLPEGLSDQISQKKSLIRRLGPVNPNAQFEYKEVNDRYIFLSEQLHDLEKAQIDLRTIVEELDTLMKREFLKTFRKVAVEFENIFTQLFNGGKARLVIEDEENVLDSGIDIEATLPGRRKQELALLSGGERSLTAVALIFALLKISPTPFCILDEIDAMLDESNVMRVGEMLQELSDTTQFITITHNRNTVQLADIIYGVTMGKDSVSQVISLKLDELTDEMVH